MIFLRNTFPEYPGEWQTLSIIKMCVCVFYGFGGRLAKCLQESRGERSSIVGSSCSQAIFLLSFLLNLDTSLNSPLFLKPKLPITETNLRWQQPRSREHVRRAGSSGVAVTWCNDDDVVFLLNPHGSPGRQLPLASSFYRWENTEVGKHKEVK